MKSAHASLVVFSGLAALAAGEALPASDIPIQCATICGPMVELTAMCSPRGRLIKRRRLDEAVRFRGGSGRAAGEGAVRDDDRLERREFVTLVPAPASFPDAPKAGGGAATTSSSSTSSQLDIQQEVITTKVPIPTRVTPVIVKPPPTPTPAIPLPPQAPAAAPPPPPAAYISSWKPSPQPATLPAMTADIAPGANGPPRTTTTTTTTKTNPPAAASSTGSSTLLSSSSGSQIGQPVGAPAVPVPMDAEEKCVCLNRSFDVARLAGLCASCIMQADDAQNSESSPAHVIFIPRILQACRC